MTGYVVLLALAYGPAEPLLFMLLFAWLTRGGFLTVTLKRSASGRTTGQPAPAAPETARSNAP